MGTYDADNAAVETALNDLDLRDLIPHSGEKQAGAAVYAWPEAEAYPIHTAHAAARSLAFGAARRTRVPDSIYHKIKTACECFGVNAGIVEARARACLVAATEKRAAHAQVTLCEDDYILPHYGLWPVKTASDWRMACEEYVHQGSKLHPDTRAQAAVRLLQKAASLDIKVADVPSDLYKRAGLTLSDAGTLCEHLTARASLASSPEGAHAYKQAAAAIENSFPFLGVLVEREHMVKIAQAVSTLDTKYGMDRHYGSRIVDPYLAVFNTTKLASQNVDLAGTQVPVSILLDLGEQELSDQLGEDFMSEVRAPDGEVDPGMFAAVVATLPRPLKLTLLDQVRQSLANGDV